MKDIFYLIMTSSGVDKVRKQLPSLSSGEVAIKVTVNISDKFFQRFIPSADLTIPDEYVLEPKLEAEIKGMSKEELEAIQKTIQLKIENTKENELKIAWRAIEKLSETNKEIHIPHLAEYLECEIINFEEILDKLKREGMIFEPRHDYIQKI